MTAFAPVPTRMSVPDFLAWEERQELRYELVDGRPVAMVGGTAAHSRICSNLERRLGPHMEGRGCEVHREGIKLQVDGKIYYPDLLLTCARIPDQATVAHDAVVVVEVLSNGTEGHDRVRKRRSHQMLPSLQHYVLVGQNSMVVEWFTRDGETWAYGGAAGPDGVLSLKAIDFEMPLSEIYRNTEVPPGLTDEGLASE